MRKDTGTIRCVVSGNLCGTLDCVTNGCIIGDCPTPLENVQKISVVGSEVVATQPALQAESEKVFHDRRDRSNERASFVR